MLQKLPQNEWSRTETAQSPSAGRLFLEEFSNPSEALIAAASRGVLR